MGNQSKHKGGANNSTLVFFIMYVLLFDYEA